MVLLRHLLINLALRIVGGNFKVLEQARLFLDIRWLSVPAVLANMVLLGWLLGVQHVRAPVILLIVGNLLNIVLDIWLLMGLGWKMQGVAMETAISEYARLLLGLGLVWRVMRLRGISLLMLQQAWPGNLSRLLALNRDIMLQLVTATTVLLLADPLCRTSRQRGDGDECGINEPFGLFRLCFRQLCLCG